MDAVVAAFHDAYKRRYGHDHEEAVEIVNLRTISVGQTPRPVLSRLQTNGAAGRGTAVRAMSSSAGNGIRRR